MVKSLRLLCAKLWTLDLGTEAASSLRNVALAPWREPEIWLSGFPYRLLHLGVLNPNVHGRVPPAQEHRSTACA